ncbi:MAG: DNA mismatch repair endonuclease MutL [Cytophagales bacterium]|nr:DNA mismatch repair endonuclease MutL [Cytophagales bacterium]
MEDIVRLLPESIANQIAAGEVVQRPASVVKELLENSIDAEATEISLILRESGKSLIRVLDNGVGMSTSDARMSFERHATSKIRRSEDLFSIRTMGFRGEALASIAAVAQVELKTRKRGAELGTEIVIHGSEIKKNEPVFTNEGTSLCVKNLFYNVPARRNFLKSNPVELRHILDEFNRVALANPGISFNMYHNDKEVHQLEPGKLSKRIVQLFGKNYQNQLIPCQEDTSDLQIRGYVGKPEFAKKTRGDQFFFVNHRFIKNNYLNHAVNTAFESLLPEGFHPFYVLFLEMDTANVDINVHPTKTEVKFQDDRLLYGIIQSAVRQALSQFNVAPSLDFSADVNFNYATTNLDRSATQITPKDRDYSNFKSIDTGASNKSIENWQDLYQVAKQEDLAVLRKAEQEWPQAEIVTLKSDLSTGRLELESSEKWNQSLQLHGQYLIRQVKSGMVIIDQCAAHERILYEKYLSELKGNKGASQSCLFPQQVDLSPSDFALIKELSEEIRALGFDIDEFGQSSLVINGVPADLSGQNEKEVLEGLLEQFKQNKEELQLEHHENLARSLAVRTSMRKGKILNQKETDELIDRLFACEQPNYTPNGNSIFVVLGLDRISSFFKE